MYFWVGYSVEFYYTQTAILLFCVPFAPPRSTKCNFRVLVDQRVGRSPSNRMLHAFRLLGARSELFTEAFFGSGRVHHFRKGYCRRFSVIFEEKIGVSIHIQGRYVGYEIGDAITDPVIPGRLYSSLPEQPDSKCPVSVTENWI